MTSKLFTKVLLGGESYKLRLTPEYRWRILTLENPKWASDFKRRGLLALACQVWALLDEPEECAIKGPKDVLALLNEKNCEDVMRAVSEAIALANPEPGTKNADGSTPLRSPASS
jgi:hypothetical protein